MARREIGQGLIVAVGLAEGERPVGVGRRVIGIELDRLVEIRDRVAVAADAGIGGAAGVVGARIVRVALDHVGEGRDVDAARALRVLLHHRDALGGAAAGGARRRQGQGDEGEAQGCETANRWGEHLRLQLITHVPGKRHSGGKSLTAVKQGIRKALPRRTPANRVEGQAPDMQTAPRFRRRAPIHNR